MVFSFHIDKKGQTTDRNIYTHCGEKKKVIFTQICQKILSFFRSAGVEPQLRSMMTWFSSVVMAATQTYNTHSCRKQGLQQLQPSNRDNLPLRKEGIYDSVPQRIDGQLWYPLEIFSTANIKK